MLSASAFMLSFFFLDLNRDDMLLVNDLRGVASPDELRGVLPPAMIDARCWPRRENRAQIIQRTSRNFSAFDEAHV